MAASKNCSPAWGVPTPVGTKLSIHECATTHLCSSCVCVCEYVRLSVFWCQCMREQAEGLHSGLGNFAHAASTF